MENQHLTYFKIENFKRFDSFEMSNLGQFNLIVGDNNVGKTSVLEALTFSPNITELAHNYFGMTVSRRMHNLNKIMNNKAGIQITEFWSLLFKDSGKPINLNINENEQYAISIISQEKLSDVDKELIRKNLLSATANEWLKLSSNIKESNNLDITGAYFENIDLNSNHYTPFIDANANYSDSLVEYFYEYFNANKELRKELEKNLRMFVKDLEEIRTHKFHTDQETLCVTLNNSNGIYPITQYGDGTLKATRIIMEVFITSNKRLLVDEIGAGIHFTRLKGYWKVILHLCIKYNVQLFATTHSLECQQAFVEAFEAPEMQPYQKDARNISLIENKEGEVKAITYDFEQFENALNIGFNTRGGVI